MWTRHASRVAAEKSFFGAAIHVSVTFSTIARPKTCGCEETRLQPVLESRSGFRRAKSNLRVRRRFPTPPESKPLSRLIRARSESRLRHIRGQDAADLRPRL